MRKLLTVIVASGAMVAVMPATALAKSHRHHSRAHHGRVHHKRFGTDPALAAAAPTPTSPAPVASTAPPSGATIASFTNGVLTINTVNPAGTAAGFVTVDTQIECISPSSTTGMTEPTDEFQNHDHGGFGDNGFGPGQGGDDQGQGDDNQGDDDQGEMMQGCDMSALTAGASIQFADLQIAADGVATWDKVVVIVAPTTPPTTAPPTVADTDGDGN